MQFCTWYSWLWRFQQTNISLQNLRYLLYKLVPLTFLKAELCAACLRRLKYKPCVNFAICIFNARSSQYLRVMHPTSKWPNTLQSKQPCMWGKQPFWSFQLANYNITCYRKFCWVNICNWTVRSKSKASGACDFYSQCIVTYCHKLNSLPNLIHNLMSKV